MRLPLALSLLAFAAAVQSNKWTLREDSPFPSFWFGSNETGPDGPHLVQNNITKYSAAWFGWQSLNQVGQCAHEEAKLHLQTASVRAAAPSMITLAYGADVMNVMPFYDKQNAALSDKANSGWFLHSKHLSGNSSTAESVRTIAGLGDCPFNDNPAYDFRNASARKYFAEVVIGQWASDSTVDSVFVDEADAIVCTWSATGRTNGLPTIEDVYAYSNGSVLAYKQAASILAAQGKRLVVSLKNGYIGSSPVNAKIGVPCAVPMDEIVKGMAGVPWIRFHEYFATVSALDEEKKANGTEMCHNTIMTAVREGQSADMAFAAHGGDYCCNQGGSCKQCSLEFSFVIFMLGRNGMIGQPTDFFSWSTGRYWNTKDWSWDDGSGALYSKQYGAPMSPAVRQGSVWLRQYQRATVSIDCATLEPTIHMALARPHAV